MAGNATTPILGTKTILDFAEHIIKLGNRSHHLKSEAHIAIVNAMADLEQVPATRLLCDVFCTKNLVSVRRYFSSKQ
jgi:hypothetical protein